MSSSLTQLAVLVHEVDQRSPDDGAEVFSVSESRGIIPQRELFTKQIATEDRTKYRRIQYGDVIFNPYLLWNGAAGVCFHKGGGCVSPAYPVLRPKHSGTERFLHYLFRSSELASAVNAIASGSVTRRRTAPLDTILNLAFRLPDVPAQRVANQFLKVLDDRIELNRQLAATLEVMAQALFQSWFVDFDPVRAKLDGRKPYGMDSATAELFPATFRHTAQGRIPEGWTVDTIGDFANNHDSQRAPIKEGERVRGPYPYYGASGIVTLTTQSLMANTYWSQKTVRTYER
jgi:type I restriction enzyme, S subunit